MGNHTVGIDQSRFGRGKNTVLPANVESLVSAFGRENNNNIVTNIFLFNSHIGKHKPIIQKARTPSLSE